MIPNNKNIAGNSSFRNFQPPPGLRNAHSQSFLASFRLRNRLQAKKSKALDSASVREEIRCETSEGPVTLESWVSTPKTAPKATVILIHGWEGSQNSAYLYSLACHLFAADLAVVRLNLRDHGATHHLNERLFHACRLEEVMESVAHIARRNNSKPLYLCGFSMGGNFALRVAMQASQGYVSNGVSLVLDGVFAISPLLNPRRVSDAIDSQGGYRRYFMRKWRRSILAKQAAFPDLYDFSDGLNLKSVDELLDYFIAGKHTPYSDPEEYLRAYGVDASELAVLKSPTTILTAADDPVVPVIDANQIAEHANLKLAVMPHGGHCGFIENWRLQSYIDQFVLHGIESLLTVKGRS